MPKFPQMEAPEGTKGVLVPGISQPIYFPEDMGNDEIAVAIERDILPQRAGILREQIKASRQKMFGELPATDRFLVGAGQGLANVGAGLKQGALQLGEAAGFVEPGSAKRYTRERMEDTAPLDESVEGSGLATFGRVVGEAAPLALVPGGAAAGLGRAALTSAAGGAFAANVPFVREGESRVGRTLGGALGGAGGTLLLRGAAKGLNAARGRFADPASRDLVRAAESEGIPISYGDVTQGPLVKKIEKLQENMPGRLGTSGFRQRGSEGVTGAVSRRTGGLHEDMRNAVWENLPAVQKAAQDGDEMAKVVLSQIEEAGDDWMSIVHASGNLNRLNKKLQADDLYDEVRRLAGDQNVPMTRTRAMLDRVIEELDNSKVPEKNKDLFKTALRNLSETDDFETALRKTGETADLTKLRAGDAAAMARAADKAALQAGRAQKNAASKQGKAMADLANLKRHGTDFGWWHEEALKYARGAAQETRQAAVDAQARVAVGGVTKTEAEAAARRAAQSFRELAITDGAATLARGTPPEGAARILIQKYKLQGPDLQGALAEAQRRVAGAPARVGGVDNSFGTLQHFRSRLRKMASELSRQGDDYSASMLQDVKGALQKDMAEFAQGGGFDPNSTARAGLEKAWRRADNYYRTEVVPVKERGLATAFKNDNPDAIAKRFRGIGRFDTHTAERLYKALDPKGQAAARFGMVSEAAEQATDPVKGFISPAKFAGYLERKDAARSVFFRGRAGHEIEGFIKLLRHVEEHGRFAENPPTGARVATAMVGGGALGMFSIPVMLQTLTGSAGLRLLLTTPRGRDFLLSANNLQVGGRRMTAAVQALMRNLQAEGAIAAGAAGSAALGSGIENPEDISQEEAQ